MSLAVLMQSEATMNYMCCKLNSKRRAFGGLKERSVVPI